MSISLDCYQIVALTFTVVSLASSIAPGWHTLGILNDCMHGQFVHSTFFKDQVCSGSILITGDKVVNEIGFLPYAVANEKIAQRNGMSDDVT